MLIRFAISASVLCAMALPALAHPGDAGHAGSLGAGFAHPFLGVDHVLAMVPEFGLSVYQRPSGYDFSAAAREEGTVAR